MVGREGSACSRPLTTTLAPPAQRTTGANNRLATHIELSALQVRSITKHAKGDISISQITTTRMQKRFRRIEPFGSADVSLASGLGGLEEVRASLLTAGSHRRSKFRVAFEELEGGVAQNRAAVPLVGAVARLLARSAQVSKRFGLVSSRACHARVPVPGERKVRMRMLEERKRFFGRVELAGGQEAGAAQIKDGASLGIDRHCGGGILDRALGVAGIAPLQFHRSARKERIEVLGLQLKDLAQPFYRAIQPKLVDVQACETEPCFDCSIGLDSERVLVRGARLLRSPEVEKQMTQQLARMRLARRHLCRGSIRRYRTVEVLFRGEQVSARDLRLTGLTASR